MSVGERESCPLPLARKDGVLIPVETRVWRGKWNGLECVFGICKNLSAEQDAQQRFERIFRSNPSLIALATSSDRKLTDVNDTFLTTLGYSWAECIGKTTSELNLFVYPERHRIALEQLQTIGHIDGVELQVRRKDGTILDGLFSCETISNQGRQYILIVMTDITERKIAETELARLAVIQSELMHLATDFVNVPLERQDTAIDHSLATMGQLIHADRAYLFAYDFDAGVMSNTHEWCGDGITPEIENLQNIGNEGVPDWVAAHRRGELIHIPSVESLPSDSSLRQILEPQGIRSLITLPLMQGEACLGFVGFDAVREGRVWREEEVSILRVLAELYAHFEARRFAERQTLELQNKLMEARDAAQAAALAKSMFLANMSHEIRTPLNAILGYAQIMRRECYACPMGDRLKAITRSGEHLLALLTDLLELVRSDAHTITLAPGSFDVYQALDDVRIIFARNPAAQTLKLKVTHAPNVPKFICTDSGKIRQILVNLVGNAFKFTVKGGVSLSMSVLATNAPDGVTLAVDVEDTGCGIAKDDMERIFRVFEQTENSRKSGKGTGLGLHLSQLYARALGGDITVTSRLGEGSCFRFTFRAQVAAVDASEQSRHDSVRRLAADQRAYRVLVVDDDPLSREILAALLEPVGFTVETVASPVKALDRLDAGETVDLVLIDKQMPEMDGYEAIRSIRQLPSGRELPVLVVTASGFGDEIKQALSAGADGFVSKPVRREQLLEEIGRVVSAKYDYDAAEATADIAQLDSAALARLPAQQLLALDQAVRRGDILMLRTIVATIVVDHAELAASIRALVDTYNYKYLRRLLDATKGKIV
jgi:PAS domain S-box-containing protein